MKPRTVILTPTLKRLSWSDQSAVLDAYERDADLLIARGDTYARKAGRELQRQIDRIRAEIGA